MTAGFWIAACFLAFSIAALLFFIFTRSGLFASLRKFYIMSASVYLSGTALIFIFFLIVDQLPFIFAVISEVCILSVFVVSVWAIHRMGKLSTENLKKNEDKNVQENTDA